MPFHLMPYHSTPATQRLYTVSRMMSFVVCCFDARSRRRQTDVSRLMSSRFDEAAALVVRAMEWQGPGRTVNVDDGPLRLLAAATGAFARTLALDCLGLGFDVLGFEAAWASKQATGHTAKYNNASSLSVRATQAGSSAVRYSPAQPNPIQPCRFISNVSQPDR